MKSNWPLVVSFPIFLNNCLDHFTEIRDRMNQTNIKVGTPIVISQTAQDVVVNTPDGTRHELQSHGTSDYSYPDVTRCGIYTVERADTEPLSIAVNLFDTTESSLDVVDEPMIDGNLVVATASVARFLANSGNG